MTHQSLCCSKGNGIKWYIEDIDSEMLALCIHEAFCGLQNDGAPKYIFPSLPS